MATRYIDISATNNGDGTTPAQAGGAGAAGAYNTFFGNTITSGDTVWVRRAGSLSAISGTFTAVTNVTYIGWPVTTDDDYAGRTAAGIAQGWDNDSTAALPTITSSTGNNSYTVGSGAAGAFFKRIKFSGTNAGSRTGTMIALQGAASFKYCTISDTGTGTNSVVSITATTGNCQFNQIILTCVGGTVGINHNAASTLQVLYSTMSKSAQATNASGGLVAITSSSGGAEIARSTFTVADLTQVPTTCVNLTGNVSTAVAPPVFVDCVIDNSVNSTAAGGEAAVKIQGRAIVRGMSVKGSGVVVSIATQIPVALPLHFSQITQTYPLAKGALDLSGSGVGQIPVAIGSFTPIAGNSSDDLTEVAGNLVTMQSCVFAGPTRTNALALVSDPRNGIFMASRNGIVGSYGASVRRARSRTNQIGRSGGSAFSYRYDFDQTMPVQQGMVLPISNGFAGFADLHFAPLTSGTRTITVYGAYKGFASTPTADEIWVEVSYLGGADSTVSTVSSKAGNPISPVGLTADSSTWTGDTGLTAFKLVLTVTVSQTQNAPVRFRTVKPMGGLGLGFGQIWDTLGFFVLDPVPVVT